ncbi:hypothetical protein G7Y41_08780 [Schaalia sp. ZJ405]|uniref:hypothetical protein n=1 Tax=Schaalia sp. ZJ405 TaxID=2709403 RepID=UPI0013EDA469|nr:hypothetical protein [Schaalia sp. ZJ405]QPK81119.1 hypothetical protein G7Y41_08780 [Schaalia sp. ZJ405]
MLTITPDDYTQWRENNGFSTAPPSVPAENLRSAVLLVAQYLSKSTPIKGDSRKVIIDAVCTQARFWVDTGITPFTEGVQAGGKVVASASLNGGSISYADTLQAKVSNREKAAETLCLEARILLRLAGANLKHPQVIG